MKLIVGNPVAIDAFRAGIPANGKPFPDGSKMTKVEWRPKKSPDAPYVPLISETESKPTAPMREAIACGDFGDERRKQNRRA